MRTPNGYKRGVPASPAIATVAAVPPGRFVRDFGPVYRETDPGRFPVEPWATASNLAFLAVIVFWSLRLRGRWRRHPVLAASLPVLAVGWIAGTIYHATRSHVAWLLLDWVPIVLLIVFAAVHLWRRLGLQWAAALALTVLTPMLAGAVFHSGRVPDPAGITLTYAFTGLALVLPALLHCALRHRRGWPWLTAALASFAAALVCRQIDLSPAVTWPMGTHFLWHLFGGAATFAMFGYLFSAADFPPTVH